MRIMRDRLPMNVVKLHPSAKDLYHSTEGSAGFDVSICDDYQFIKMNEMREKNPRGLKEYPGIMTTENPFYDYKGTVPMYNHTFYLDPGNTALIHTGLIVEIPAGYVGLLAARSGISNIYGITPKDCIGVIDSDYRGELKIHLVNTSKDRYFFSPYERVCQLIITPYYIPYIQYTDKPTETERGSRGYGSSGV